MSSTRLTIGGFTQPGVARNLIEMPSNSEKGLSHRFIWIFPKPLYGKFASLENVNKKFSLHIGKLLHACKTIAHRHNHTHKLVHVHLMSVDNLSWRRGEVTSSVTGYRCI